MLNRITTLLTTLWRAVRFPPIDPGNAEMAYLSGAFDRVNLEFRQRQIDQGLFRKPV